jgi:hypothetical protein
MGIAQGIILHLAGGKYCQQGQLIARDAGAAWHGEADFAPAVMTNKTRQREHLTKQRGAIISEGVLKPPDNCAATGAAHGASAKPPYGQPRPSAELWQVSVLNEAA